MALMNPELALPDKRLVPTLHIVNDTHFGVKVAVDAKGQVSWTCLCVQLLARAVPQSKILPQVLELERCVLEKKEKAEDHLSRSQVGAHTYKLCIKVSGGTFYIHVRSCSYLLRSPCGLGVMIAPQCLGNPRSKLT